jgi:hypothetical protein
MAWTNRLNGWSYISGTLTNALLLNGSDANSGNSAGSQHFGHWAYDAPARGWNEYSGLEKTGVGLMVAGGAILYGPEILAAGADAALAGVESVADTLGAEATGWLFSSGVRLIGASEGLAALEPALSKTAFWSGVGVLFLDLEERGMHSKQ